MGLQTQVEARISSTRLVRLTRPDDPTATTVDTTLLGYACADLEALFSVYANAAYDDSNARHVAVAVLGVELLLAKYTARDAKPEAWDAWRTTCEALGRVEAHARLSPRTDSLHDRTDETQDDLVDYDETAFDDLRPSP